MANNIPKSMNPEQSGKLYVVATPIGNLEDFSIRAQKSLKSASWIACEDTRHCKPLLNHYAITGQCLSLHSFNEKKKVDKLVQQLLAGESGALISDAGTPVISDPGFHLVSAALDAGIQVIPIPGANAAITALCALAVQEGPFYFEGFLPAKSSTRVDRLKQLSSFECQLVFYEAPHRIKSMVKDLVTVFGAERLGGIARELTKMYESIYRGPLSELLNNLEQDQIPARGEFVVIVEGNRHKQNSFDAKHKEIIETLLPYLSINKVAKVASKLTGMSRNDCYDIALSLQNK